MLQGVVTITVGILSAIALLGGAVTAGAKLWKYRVFRIVLTPVTWTVTTLWTAYDAARDERFASKVDEAIGRLFQPDGGASLRDLSDRFTEMERRMGIINKYTDPQGYATQQTKEPL